MEEYFIVVVDFLIVTLQTIFIPDINSKYLLKFTWKYDAVFI